MSQPLPSTSSGGKAVKDRKRRLSDPAPYRKPPKSQAMPTTRRSPPRTREPSPPEVEILPPGEVLKELALLRKSIEAKFVESAERTDGVKAEILSKLESNDQAVSELQLSVADVTLSVDRNERSIQEVRAEVERREVELPSRVREIVNEALNKNRQALAGIRPRALGGASGNNESAGVSPPLAASVGVGKDGAYSLARRSLRLWPVSKEGNLKERTIEFLVNELLLDQQYAASLDFDVKRVGRRNGSEAAAGAVKDEVLVAFSSARERDDVRSYAKNLERKGRGLRLEVPEHLWPSFRLLQNLGYELKLKNPALKRNVLFDDLTSDLKMDVSFGSDEWKTITPEEARKTLAKCRPSRAAGRPQMSSNELENRLGTNADESVDMQDEREF